MANFDKTQSEKFKTEGNTAFSAKQYIQAVAFYDQAIQVRVLILKKSDFRSVLQEKKLCWQSFSGTALLQI